MLLEPGLSMYLPTGTPHAARAQDTVSLHVTIGINQVTWRTLLDRAVSRAMEQVEADAHLPAGYLEEPDALAAGLDERLQTLRDALADTDAPAVADEQTRSFLEKRNGHLRGSLVDRMDLDARRRRHRAAPPAGQALRAASRRRPAAPAARRPSDDGAGADHRRRRTGPHPRGVHSRRPRPGHRVRPGPVSSADPRGTARGRPLTPSARAAARGGDFRCSAASEQRQDDLAGTATHVTAFLLVEHHGPWGASAPQDSRLPQTVRSHLTTHKNIKVLLARRHHRAHRGPDFRVFLCFPARRLLFTATFTDPEELTRLDLDAVVTW